MSTQLDIARAYALSHGLLYKPLGTPPPLDSAIHAPFALNPQPFPSTLFQQASLLQPIYNALYAHIAVDNSFLQETMGETVAKVDPFQQQLFQLWHTVINDPQGIKQPLQLGLFRSDYLLHSPPGSDHSNIQLKQVEFNTISSSFGALSTKVSDLHRYLSKANAYSTPISLESLPDNLALKGLSAGLAAAHNAYVETSGTTSKPRVLMIVQDDERNAFDQRALEWELLESHSIPLLRLPFSTLSESVSTSPLDSSLQIKLPSSEESIEISVVYYRAGYTPSDYPTDVQWNLRLLIEKSLAIKCPSIGLQLAGAKKVQQVISQVEVLGNFLEIGSVDPSSTTSTTSPKSKLTISDSEELLKSFSGLYPLDQSPSGEAALKLAYETPEKFVLKPQREGGGNNVYRTDIPTYLNELSKKDQSNLDKGGDGKVLEREGYILMELIEPPLGSKSILVRSGADPKESDVISELGIFGVTLFKAGAGGKGAEIWLNQTSGHLLRTKGRESDEGGVAVGFSVIDSPWLV